MDWRQYIDRDPAVLTGKPKLRGTRLSVEHILSRLGDGWSADQLMEAYPQLSPQNIQACQAYAAEIMATESILDVPLTAS